MMDVEKSISLLAYAQASIIVAKSKPVENEFKIKGVTMDRDAYLELHNVNPDKIQTTIEALVAALEDAKTDMKHLGLRASLPTFGFTAKIDAALALARKGGE